MNCMKKTNNQLSLLKFQQNIKKKIKPFQKMKINKEIKIIKNFKCFCFYLIANFHISIIPFEFFYCCNIGFK